MVYGPNKENRAVFVKPSFLRVPTIRAMTGRKYMLYLKTSAQDVSYFRSGYFIFKCSSSIDSHASQAE